MSMPATPDMRPLIQETLAHFDRKGLPHPIVSGGSTSGAFMAHEIPELTEYRPASTQSAASAISAGEPTASNNALAGC